MSATLSPTTYIGRRVVIVTMANTIFGAEGSLTLQSVDETGALILALPKGAPTARIPAKSIRTITPIREES